MSNTFYTLQKQLAEIAANPSFPCWLGGDDVDQGPSYCRTCAEKKVTAGKAEFVDGGWGPQEEDSCCHCDACGCLLYYSLTEYGADLEKDHFTDNPPTQPISQETAFHLLALLEAKMDDEDVRGLIASCMETTNA